MPITVRHDAPAEAIATGSYIQGLGDFQRFLAQRQLQYDTLAQHGALQQQALAAQMFGHQQNLQAQAAEHAAQRQFQGQRDVFDAQNKADADNQQAQNLADWHNAQLKQQRDLAGARGDMDAMQEERLWSGGLMDAMQKAQKEGYQVNQLEYDKAYADYQSIQKDQSLNPQERWLASGEARRRIENVVRTAKPAPGGPPQTIQQKVESGSYAQPVLGPNGEFMGHTLWTETMRNGTPTLQPKFIPFKEPDDPAKDYAKFVDTFVGKEKSKDPDTGAVTPYSAADIQQLWQTRQQAMAGMQTGAPIPQAAPPQSVAPTPNGIPTPEQTAAEFAQMQQDKLANMPGRQQLDPQTQQMSQGVLPHPQTPEEARKLPKGSWFVSPDGRILRVPTK